MRHYTDRHQARTSDVYILILILDAIAPHRGRILIFATDSAVYRHKKTKTERQRRRRRERGAAYSTDDNDNTRPHQLLLLPPRVTKQNTDRYNPSILIADSASDITLYFKAWANYKCLISSFSALTLLAGLTGMATGL